MAAKQTRKKRNSACVNVFIVSGGYNGKKWSL